MIGQVSQVIGQRSHVQTPEPSVRPFDFEDLQIFSSGDLFSFSTLRFSSIDTAHFDSCLSVGLILLTCILLSSCQPVVLLVAWALAPSTRRKPLAVPLRCCPWWNLRQERHCRVIKSGLPTQNKLFVSFAMYLAWTHLITNTFVIACKH